MNPQVKNTLRWVAVLPASFGAFVVVQLIEILGSWMLPVYFVQLSNSYLGPVAFVVAGAYTAPRFRFATALVLTVGESAVLLGLLLLLLSGAITPKDDPLWWTVVNCIISLVATVWTCYGIHRAVVNNELPE